MGPHSRLDPKLINKHKNQALSKRIEEMKLFLSRQISERVAARLTSKSQREKHCERHIISVALGSSGVQPRETTHGGRMSLPILYFMSRLVSSAKCNLVLTAWTDWIRSEKG